MRKVTRDLPHIHQFQILHPPNLQQLLNTLHLLSTMTPTATTPSQSVKTRQQFHLQILEIRTSIQRLRFETSMRRETYRVPLDPAEQARVEIQSLGAAGGSAFPKARAHVGPDEDVAAGHVPVEGTEGHVVDEVAVAWGEGREHHFGDALKAVVVWEEDELGVAV